MLADLGAPAVADPLQALLRLAGEALALKNALGEMVNRLDEIRYRAGNGSEQLRAEVALYERAVDRAATLLGMIARLNIDERLARMTERQADAVIAAIDAALAHAGITGQEAAAAKKVAARHLRAIAPAPEAGA